MDASGISHFDLCNSLVSIQLKLVDLINLVLENRTEFCFAPLTAISLIYRQLLKAEVHRL